MNRVRFLLSAEYEVPRPLACCATYKTEAGARKRVFKLGDFAEALAFTNRVGEIAEAEGASSCNTDRMGKSDGDLVDS